MLPGSKGRGSAEFLDRRKLPSNLPVPPRDHVHYSVGEARLLCVVLCREPGATSTTSRTPADASTPRNAENAGRSRNSFKAANHC